mmetsp:Transcript_107343/g.148421  ORF Transcript_107343/g.148421 Transcript_107343/m.148421 type:complete len:81 (+) Transcript_107343:313-555(+)
MNTEIKKEFNFTNVEMGALGSSVYAGNVVGSLFAMPLFNYFPTKPILVFCLLSQIMALSVFTITTTFHNLALVRFLTGMA